MAPLEGVFAMDRVVAPAIDAQRTPARDRKGLSKVYFYFVYFTVYFFFIILAEQATEHMQRILSPHTRVRVTGAQWDVFPPNTFSRMSASPRSAS